MANYLGKGYTTKAHCSYDCGLRFGEYKTLLPELKVHITCQPESKVVDNMSSCGRWILPSKAREGQTNQVGLRLREQLAW